MLEIDRLSVAYGEQEIVKDVGFAVGKGETVCLVGESGSGKSTVLKAIIGLLGAQGHITGGTVRFQGEDLRLFKDAQLAHLRGRKITMVYQQAGRSMDPTARIGKQFYEELHMTEKLSRRASDEKAIACMRSLSLREPERLLKAYPSMLSGGTNQRVALAMALVMNPELILADEPTSALDVTVQAEVVKAMLQMKKEYGSTILLVTHNMGVVAQMADRVGVMYGGYLLEWGTKSQILSAPLHPYTQMLAASVLRLDGRSSAGRILPESRGKGRCPFYARCPKAAERCREELPSMEEVEGERRIRCHLAGGRCHG